MKALFLLYVNVNADLYNKLSNILSTKNIIKDFFRWLGWELATLLANLCNACEELYKYANKTLSFIYSDNVSQFIEEWKYAIYGVLIISILIFGISLMTNKKPERSKLLSGVFIAVIVLTGLTNSMQSITDKVSDYSGELIGTNSTSSEAVIKNAIVDLYYVESYDFSEQAIKQGNQLNTDRILKIDPNSTIKASDNGLSNPDFFTKKLEDGKNGEMLLVDIDDGGITDLNNDTYYRYHIDYTTILLTLAATAIVMVFTSFKVVKIMYEIIVNEILALLLAAGDWAEANKLKEVVKSLFALFFSVFMCSVMIHIYFIYAAFLSDTVDNAIARGLLLVFGAFAVIDGPNIVEKIFGVDAGLSSTFRSVSTLFFAARGLGSAVSGATHLAGGLIKGAGHAAGAGAGLFSGIKNGINNAKNGASGDNLSASQGKDNNISNQNSDSKNGNKNSSSSDTSGRNKSNANSSGDSKDNNISQPTNSEQPSIANKSDNQNASANKNGFDYADYKSRNPRSIIGAGVRGNRKGNYFGEKIGNKAASISNSAKNRKAKGD
ncbi:MAG: hypothetical protein NC548_33640 [Lachnospiraceae bacterium]|nr:hypothetical protein [Lachnospiraceae bacterium]